MNWGIEREVSASGKLAFDAEDCNVNHEKGEDGGIPKKQLAAGRAAAEAALKGVTGKRLVTISGHQAPDDGASHISVTVSRVLE